MFKSVRFCAWTALLLIASACEPQFGPLTPADDNKLPPTGKSVSTYLALHVTDNRSSYRKMALAADQCRTVAGTADGAQANSLEAARAAIGQGLEFVRLDVRRVGNKSYCTDHLSDGETYPELKDMLSECRGKVFVCMDASKSLHIPNTCALVDSLSMQDEIIFCLGSLGGPGDAQEESDGWRNYVSFSNLLDKVVPLFDVSSMEEIDFIVNMDLPTVVTFRLKDSSLASYCHSSGFAVFTDVSAADDSIQEGDNSALQQAAAIKSDIVCTGVADGDRVKDFLSGHNLNR